MPDLSGLIPRILAGLALSVAIACMAYRRHSLSKSGVWGAILLGTVTLGFGGWVWGALLIAFFVSSSFLSHYRAVEKEHLMERFAKGGRRDISQAFANGGLGAMLALAHFFWPNAAIFVAFLGSMAAASADTWATESGVLSKGYPRLITNGRIVPPGTSGGVTLLGLGAAALASLATGLLAILFRALGAISGARIEASLLWLVPVAVFGGFFGSLFDSLLGATLQGVYFCPQCQGETERVVHRCGQRTIPLRGWRWLSNDGVNFFSTLFGALLAYLLYRIVA